MGLKQYALSNLHLTSTSISVSEKVFFFFLLLVVVAMTHRKHTHLYASKFMRRFALIIYGWMCGGRSTCEHYAAQCARTCCTLPQTFTLIFKKGTRTLKNVSAKHVKLIVVNYSWREQRGDARAGIFIFFLCFCSVEAKQIGCHYSCRGDENGALTSSR